MSFWDVIKNRQEDIIQATLEHIQISFIALIIAIVISIPTGLILTRFPRLASPIIGVASLFQTIPSLALLGFMIPLVGIGMVPAIVALTVYALLPIMRNTYTGIMNVEKSIKEAGVGMGMTSWQVMTKIELPLALNVIMAGIRTATVMIIGVATLASLVGAGGLGDLIFRGISTVNTELILAGTIPAALLALLFDFILERMEKAVTPKGVKKRGKERSKVFKRIELTLIAVLIIGLIVGVVAMRGGQGGADSIVVGGKNYTEQDILVHMLASLIEDKTELKVIRKPFLGGSQVTHNALVSGDIDLFPEYTGTGWTSVLKEKPIAGDPEVTYEKVKAAYEEKFQVTWLKPFGFNNTYTLAMKRDHAEKLGIETFSDLALKSSSLVLGATHEFLERPDGYLGLKSVYGMNFKEAKGLDAGLTYSAVKEGTTDVNDAFATDGRIQAFNLKVIMDDKKFFPPYYAAPIVRMDTLEKHPELQEVLNLLAGKIDDGTMSALNGKVDLDGKQARVVAEEWLKEQGLIK
ncbi:osmoprotectant transport system permease protein [Paenibacillus castaneae]|uniref:glycine betaine ABC transporter substrate-binding protein n=1 Tax=Paenibacillus castaneae TaxID=474957 RepID=UPI000C9C2726|nr:glycine betaine ABC transporter substrate-binding protein [Paenibacillus castaneae]NIK79153.1 osmoprotectant transport system permease protein [Paenibacillus castaneae]